MTDSALLVLLDATLKSAVLLTAALALTRALRRTAASVRMTLWATALAGSLLIPALSAWLPSLPVAALPVPAFLQSEVASSAPPPTATAMASVTPPTRSAPTAPPNASSRSSTRDNTSAGPARRAWPSPALWIGLVWLAGLSVALTRQLAGLRRAARLTAGAVELAGEGWHEVSLAARRRTGVDRAVRLLITRRIQAPITWGERRPVILVPAAAARWSRERRLVVLLHELVHIRRHDWLARVAARLACAVYWFNPLAWLAARRLTIEQEMACDEEVLALGTRPSTYAGHLLAIARSLGRVSGAPRPMAVVDMAERSNMEGRLMRILEENRPRLARRLMVPTVLFLSALVPALAAMRPWEGPTGASPFMTPGADGGHQLAAPDRLVGLVGQLSELEAELEPMERELEALEARLEPIEQELETVERDLEPAEEELETIERKLEPYEARLEEIETRLEPRERELKAIEKEMEEVEARLEARERDLAPFELRIEAIEAEMEPIESQLEAVERELEPSHRELERLSRELERLTEKESPDPERLEALHRQMENVHESMEPLHDRLSVLHAELDPIHARIRAAHDEARPTYERLAVMHSELEPYHQRMTEVLAEMEPIHRELREIHQEMEPVYREMSSVHETMEPTHDRMREYHQRMTPVHDEMQEVHARMEPVHQRMSEVHHEIRNALAAVIEDMLAARLGAMLAPGTAIDGAAAEILDASHVRLDDGRLRLRASTPELVEIFDRTLGPSKTVAATEFAAAIERAALDLTTVEVAVTPPATGP